MAVADDAELALAQAVLEEVLRRMPGVLDEPAPWSQILEGGDCNLPIPICGPIDQRETAFFRARRESIRLVRKALEAAGFELPEPVHRSRSELPGRPPTGCPSAAHAVEPRTDISERGDPISEQIDDERTAVAPSDLLDPSAPQE